MSNAFSPTSDPLLFKTFSLNTAQVAGSYIAATATGTDVWIKSIGVFVSVAALGLVSVSIQTNNSTPDIIMSAGAGALSGLTAGKNIIQLTSPIYLPAGNKINFTIIGTGTAGTITMPVEYYLVTSTGSFV